MAKHTRANAWNNGGTFNNQDLLWYAKGVGAMQARAIDKTSSWWFFAAIHGEYVTPQSMRGRGAFPWKNIPPPPQVGTAPLPSSGAISQYWDQCQHQSWFFPPWHRGYLLALEAQIRADVVALGGPSTWALPYWNYFGPANQYEIPPAFTQAKLPDGSPNPLNVEARYGPDGDQKAYVPTAAGIAAHPGDPNFAFGPVTEDVMTNTVYTGKDSHTKLPGFGGPETKFSHGGGTSGNLENNPHNLVHSYVGGSSPDGSIPGLMSVPALAALDPVFYLHHANIDRMWAVWNHSGNKNPDQANWQGGPASSGGREFVMPMPDGSAWVYTPKQMSDLSQLDYTYDSLPKLAPQPSLLSQRLTRLGATADQVKTAVAAAHAGGKVELVGANQGALPIKGAGALTSVALKSDVRRKVTASLTAAARTGTPDRVYLNLENVRGTYDGAVLSVYVDLKEGEKPAEHPELLAGSVGLFGISEASEPDGGHGGQGLTFILDITKNVDALQLKNALDVDSLQVRIVPHRAIPDKAEISVGRVSVYRDGV